MNPKISDWRGQRVWLIGASCGIGAALARALAEKGARLALSARSAEKLAALALPGSLLLPCDATAAGAMATAWQEIRQAWGGADLVVYLAGDYSPMGARDFDLVSLERAMQVNFSGAAHAVAAVLPDFLAAGRGGIALVSSVASYRALPKALAYGPGKAALSHFAEGLHLDLAPGGIGVWLINPGFVATRLTAQNDFAMPALLTPEQAAAEILAGFARGRFEIHFPKRFTRVMKLLALLPYRIYFPLVRRLTGASHG